MKAMPQRAELRVHAFRNLRGEAIEDLLVARQTGQARLLAPFPRMSCSVKIINDEVKIGQPSCHSRISFVAEAHSFQVTAVIMNNACETGQSVGTLSSKMKALRQGFCSNKLHDIQEQAGLGDSKKEASSACGSMGIFATLLVGPTTAFLSRLSRMPWRQESPGPAWSKACPLLGAGFNSTLPLSSNILVSLGGKVLG